MRDEANDHELSTTLSIFDTSSKLQHWQEEHSVFTLFVFFLVLTVAEVFEIFIFKISLAHIQNVDIRNISVFVWICQRRSFFERGIRLTSSPILWGGVVTLQHHLDLVGWPKTRVWVQVNLAFDMSTGAARTAGKEAIEANVNISYLYFTKGGAQHLPRYTSLPRRFIVRIQ